MITLRIGIQTASLRQPLKQALTTAARLGADPIQLDARTEVRPQEMSATAVRHLRKTLDDIHLSVCALSFQTRRGYDTAEDLDRRVAATKDALRLAFELGAPVVVNHVGRATPPADEDRPAANARRLLVEVLTDLGMFSQHCGARLAADTGGESGQDLAELLTALPEMSVAANLNPASLIVQGQSPAEAARALGPWIAHVRAGDAVPDHGRGRGAEVALGRGTADFPELLAILEEHDYRGCLTVAGATSEDPGAGIEQAISYLKHL